MFNAKNIKPMLLAEIPFQINAKYLYEIKFDGIRAMIYVNKSQINIRTRNNIDITHLFPELDDMREIVGNKDCIFDGEIVLFANKKPSFDGLQKRLRLKDKDRIYTTSLNNPVVYIAFDIIYQNKSLVDEKLIVRKKILDKYRDTNYFFKSPIYKDGKKLFKAIKKIKWEGIVAKEKNSLYYPNKRSNVWIKLKNYQTAFFYIGGYVKNSASFSLLLGEKKQNKLYYVGKIKVGMQNELMKKIISQKNGHNPFCNYQEKGIFIDPDIKVKINYLEKTKQNMLRHSFF